MTTGERGKEASLVTPAGLRTEKNTSPAGQKGIPVLVKSDVCPPVKVLLYKILQRQQNQTVLTISLSGTLTSHPPLQLSQIHALLVPAHRSGKHPSCSPGAWGDLTRPLIDTRNSAEGHSFKDGPRYQNSSHPIKGKLNLVVFFFF